MSTVSQVKDFSSQRVEDIINHGWGEMTLRVSTKDNTVRVEILCGLSHIFFLKKEIFNQNIL